MIRSAFRNMLAILFWGGLTSVSMAQVAGECDDPNLECDAPVRGDSADGCDGLSGSDCHG